MLDIVELPESDLLFSGGLLHHGVRGVMRQAAFVQGGESKAGGDQQVGEIQPIGADRGVAGHKDRSARLTAAIGDGSDDVTSWLMQLGDMEAGTIQDSWDHNSGARNANIELINRLILLSTAFADLTKSSNAMTLGDLSGSNRSTGYETGNDDDDRPVAGFCDDRQGFVWDADAKACVQRIDTQAELLLETQ